MCHQGFFGSHDFEMLGCPALDRVSVRVDRLFQGKTITLMADEISGPSLRGHDEYELLYCLRYEHMCNHIHGRIRTSNRTRIHDQALALI